MAAANAVGSNSVLAVPLMAGIDISIELLGAPGAFVGAVPAPPPWAAQPDSNSTAVAQPVKPRKVRRDPTVPIGPR